MKTNSSFALIFGIILIGAIWVNTAMAGSILIGETGDLKNDDNWYGTQSHQDTEFNVNWLVDTYDGTDFVPANLEFLGMAILAKPYGVFESDQLKEAAPPGMAYVGNSQYGEWKKDNSGNQFWSWYGKYALFSSLFFFPPSYYGYNSWNRWNTGYRHNKPYFGTTKTGSQKFGTSGSYIKKSPRFQSSTFAKSGGLKTRATSVRGAASNLRGGGPKSKGK